jgi:hypothetical protein
MTMSLEDTNPCSMLRSNRGPVHQMYDHHALWGTR